MIDPAELKERLARLSPEQRALLSQRLAAGREVSTATSYLPIEPAVPLRREKLAQPQDGDTGVAVYPASQSQQRMWFLHEYAEGSPVYVMLSSFHLAGPLDGKILAQAVADVVRRHDTLRTTFVMEGGQLFQHVASGAEFAFEAENFQAVPEDGRSAAANRYLEEVASRRFDLTAEPGFRVALARLGPEEHVLCFVLHHIISDGWSRSNLWREVGACYTARAAGAGIPLPPLASQFVDYAAWQERQLSGGTLAKQAEYWKAQLAGDLEPLELPSDRPRPTRESFRGAEAKIAIDSELTARLTARAMEEGATLFMILLAAFKVLLHRYTGREDLLVGVPVANRQRVEVEGLVGFFATTLVMRTSLAGQPTFRELLGRVKETAVQAFANQDMPFDLLVEMLQLRRHDGMSPVFQVSFALQDFPAVSLELPGIQTALWSTSTHTAKFDFSLAVVRTSAGWMATAEYNTDLFDADRVERMLGHWHVMLESIANDPGQLLHDIPLLTDRERHQLLVEWNDTDRDYPRDKCVHQLFEEQVDRTPDAVAVVMEETRLTYREMNERAECLARDLRAMGVMPESRVGLCLERSPDLVACLLGILKAGAAYVPLDPESPPARLSMILEDSACAVLITSRQFAGRCVGFKGPLLWWDDWIPLPAVSALSHRGSPHHAAYIIYTSGSTGKPKGVVVEHRAVVNFLCSMRRWPGVGADDVLLAAATAAFDISVLELFLPLLVGARMVIVPDRLRADGMALAKLLQTSGATIFQSTPTGWQMLLHAGWPGDGRLKAITGGEPLPPALATAMLERCGEVWNMYGPTETTVYSLGTRIGRGGTISIGKSIANTRVYVVDGNGRLLPPGIPGELWIGGEGLARGYLNRPELTAEKFIPDPFLGDPAARIYRSGDRCRWLADGTIECLGREDQQVKIRGYRVELGDVEAALGRLPEIEKAAVLALPTENGMSELAAWLVVPRGTNVSLSDMRESLARDLPDYMIPSRFALVKSLPLTPNGKLDRKALEKMEATSLATGGEYVAPRNEMERRLASLWQEVLRRDRVGVHDDFFALGGHSLLALTIASRIAASSGIQIPVRWIFEHRTIEALARQMEVGGLMAERFTPIPHVDRNQQLPMSFGQQRMWMVQQTEPEAATYNLPVAWRLHGPIDVSCLRRSLRVVWERHEVLRTALVREGDQLVQVISSPDAIALPWEDFDLGALLDSEQSLAVEQRMAEEARRPFDLAQAPLWRAMWLTLGEEEHLLMLVFHHSVVDEWSIRLFLGELTRLHAANAEAGAAGLAELPLQYADYAIWQRQRLAGALLERDRAYWSGQLQDLPPPVELPVDQPARMQRSGRGATHHFELPVDVADALRGLARDEGTSLFSLVLAAFQTWLFRSTNQNDLVVGSPVADRERPEVQALMGFFLNTLPLRARLDAEKSFREFLGQVRQTVREGMEHSALPFEKMVEMAVRGRDGSQSPLYQVMFVLLEQAVSPLKLDGVESEPAFCGTGTSKSDLILSVLTEGSVWACDLNYSTDLFTADCAARMAGHFTELLRSIVANPDEAVGRLNILPADERRRVLVEWNDTARDYPRDKCVHQLFEEQVDRTPDAVAVVFEGQKLTYRELNERANQLAHHLRALAVGPDVLVGLHSERSLEMVVALLGILKAGGAYVPLDPKLPLERLRFLLQDIRAPLVLCQREGWGRLDNLAKDSCPIGQIIVLEELLNGLEEYDSLNPACGNTPDDLAYVIYTSGTTGKPKGVMVPHRGIARLVIRPNYVELGPEDVLLQYAPLSFDASTFEIWGSLLNGARLVIPASGLLDFTELGNLITRNHVTTLWLTAALFHQMMEQQPAALAGVRKLLSGGDVLSPSRVRKYLEMPEHGRLINGYGPTENTTFTCCGILDHPNQVGQSVLIGRPISGTRVYILDQRGEPVPTGVLGELHTGGDGLARGYLNAPELTKERFVADSFSLDPQARLYRTGDLARWCADGQIEFVGRTDHQVKIRGYRIELGEIEHALRHCKGVSDAVVVAHEMEPGDKHLVAYLEAPTGVVTDAKALRSELAEQLPDYMIPQKFVVLEKIPLGSNGKLNRMALPGVAGVELLSGQQHVAAHTEMERRLVGIWEELLGRESVGTHDNFFELGGHSLQATLLAVEIEKLIGRKLPIAALFQSPTIASLARRLTDEQWAPAWSSLVPLQPLGSKPPVFFLHGWGGDVYIFTGLAKLLAPSQPVYGVQAVGLDGRQPRHATVEEMAAHYAEEIISLQPAEPYYLCGYSMGGLIAYETAQQLRRQGRQVAMLALLDTHPTGPISPAMHTLLLLLKIPGRFIFHLRRFWSIPQGLKFQYVHGRLHALRNMLLRNREKRYTVKLPDFEALEVPENLKEPDYHLEVAKSYRVSRYGGVLNFIASEDCSFANRLYWLWMMRGRIKFHRVPARHRCMLSPENLPDLAKALSKALDCARQESRNHHPNQNSDAGHKS